MSLLKSAATVSVFTLFSRITGLIRDMLIARYFGVSAATDAFYVAFRIPNMLRRLFAEGAFSQAFVPMLSQVKEQQPGQEQQKFVSDVFSLLGCAVFAASILGVAFAPVVVWLIASGFKSSPETFDLAVFLTRCMFPYIIFMSLVSFAAAVLNTWKHFAVPAFTPVLLNLSFIGCTLFLIEFFSVPIYTLAFAVILGGVLQLAVQFAALRRIGVLPRFSNPFKAARNGNVRQVLRLMVPAVVGVSVAPVSILINTNIASHLQDGAVTWLNYADRLMEFPTALLGVALGSVLLPSLSSAFSRGDLTRYNSLLDRGLRLVVLLAIPAAVGLGLLAEGLAAVLFQGKNFGASDVAMTSIAIEGYAVGLLGLIGIKIIAPAFYSRKDIKTPVKGAIASLVVVQCCNIVSVPLMGHAGLALSVGLGSVFNAAVLLTLLLKRGWYTAAKGWLVYFVRVVAASVAMGAFLICAQTSLDWAGMQGQWGERLLLVAGVIFGAVVTYFLTLGVLGWRGRELRGAD